MLLTGFSATASHQSQRVTPSYDPAPRANGWINASSADVTLSCATGNENCNRFYRVDNGAVQEYNAPFRIEGNGDHVLDASVSREDIANADHDTFTVRLDGNAPVVTLTGECAAGGSNGWCRGPVSLNASATDNGAGIESFTCTENDGVQPCSTTCDGPCRWTISTAGNRTVYANATDSVGHSTSVALVVAIDAVRPGYSLTTGCTVEGSSGWCRGAYTFAAGGTDGGSGLVDGSPACRLDGVPVPCEGSISSSGQHVLEVNVTDLAGNTNGTSVTLRIDSAPPVVVDPFCAIPGVAPWCLRSYTYAVNASDGLSGLASGSPVCKLDGTLVECAGTVASPGAHVLEVAAADVAGNSLIRSYALNVDNVAPTPALAIPASAVAGEDGWHLAAFQLTNASSDVGSGLALVEYSIDGGRWYTLSGASAPAITGDHSYVVRATDRAGNSATSPTLRVRVDPSSEAPRVLSESSAGTTTFTAASPLTRQFAILRPGDDTGATRISFAFDVPMDRESTLAALTGAAGWTTAWGRDDLWLNLTRADLAEGASASVTLGSGAQGAHGGSLASSVTRTIVGRGTHGYSFSPAAYDFVNISTSGTDLSIYCDDCSSQVTLPFAFTFFNKTYSKLNISSNGFVTFNGSSTGEYSPPFLPGPSATNLIAAYWEDLQTSLGTTAGNPDRVLTKTTGEAPNRVFIVSWSVVHHYPNIQPTATFQIKLFEGSNKIEIHYENAMSDGGRHLIGLMDANRTRYLTYAQADISLQGKAFALDGSGVLPDEVPPVIASHADLLAEATSASGATVSYDAPTWTDDSGESGVAECAPASGSTFAIASTTVTCTARDGAGNAATSTFVVRVVDTTPPAIAPHADVLDEATSAAGANVAYDAPATTDAASGAGSATCAPASGALFALGPTTVTCTARDGAGNSASSTFVVLVLDRTAPVVGPTANATAEATSPAGANVTYANVTYMDAVLGSGNATCAPASGSLFPMGTTLVTCNATDPSNNTGVAFFNVTVSDTTAPNVTIALDPSTPQGIAGWHTSAPIANISATDGGSGVNASTIEYSLDGTNWTAGTTFAAFPQNASKLRARASDLAGNVGHSNVSLLVDTIAPNVTSSGFQLALTAATLTFNFSEPMNRTNVEAAIGNLTHWVFLWNNESTQLTATNATIDVGDFEAVIGTNATDAHGARLASPYKRGFSRAPPPPLAFPPDAPIALAASLTDGRVRLGWSTPERDNGAAITGYRVYVDGRAPIEITGTYYDVGAMTRGAVHTFAVTAVNRAGESDPARVDLAIAPVSTLIAPGPDATGWHRERPTIRFSTDPAGANVLYDAGAGETSYSEPFQLADGETLLRWRATSGGVDETERVRRFLVDPSPPVISDASASGGDAITIRVRAGDAQSGIVAVQAVVTPQGGGEAFLVPLFHEGGGSYASRAGAAVGAYDITVTAHDAAGHETSRSAGSAEVLAPVVEEEIPEAPPAPGSPSFFPAGDGGFPIEQTSVGDSAFGSEGSPEESSTGDEPAPPPPEPTIDFDAENFHAGVRGTIVIRLSNVDNVERVRWILIMPDGSEVELANATPELAWDTTTVADGYYTIEARRGNAPLASGEIGIMSEHESTLASARVLVRNPVEAPVEVAGAVVGAVLVTAATQTALSAAASGATGSISGAAGGFDPFGFAQEVAIDAGQDKLKDKTRERDRRRRVRSLIAGALSLAILAPLWAFSETDGWSLTAWIPLIPVVGAAAALVIAMKYAAESTLAFSTGARPRIRLWIAGALSLLVSAIVFRNPFGYPAYVDEIDESEGKHTWRMQAGRALATIAGATAFMLPFLILAPWAPWTFTSIGILLAITNVATSAIPFGPLPGRDVWRWNKLLAIIVAVGGFSLYVVFAAALAPVWTLWAVSLAGAAAYITALVHFRRRRRQRAVRVPVQVPVPIATAETDAPTEAPVAERKSASGRAAKRKRGRGNA